MEKKTENKIECFECKSYYLYYSRKDNQYFITDDFINARDNEPWIKLEHKQMSNLVKLLQSHESFIKLNLPNLSEQSQGI